MFFCSFHHLCMSDLTTNWNKWKFASCPRMVGNAYHCFFLFHILSSDMTSVQCLINSVVKISFVKLWWTWFAMPFALTFATFWERMEKRPLSTFKIHSRCWYVQSMKVSCLCAGHKWKPYIQCKHLTISSISRVFLVLLHCILFL